ncbi:MAG TPA: FAD-dependent oxidoreductase, partial [Pseudorhodoferax sp.]|nr:FAD-dependent oxidoreductase [Pseudorhodoferax sp.]
MPAESAARTGVPSASPAVQASSGDRARPVGLPALEARLAQDLLYLGLPPRAWVPPRQCEGEEVLEVAIVGAGQAGLAAAIGLALQGIRAVLLDRAEAGQEGPWATTARMETLRSPKEL